MKKILITLIAVIFVALGARAKENLSDYRMERLDGKIYVVEKGDVYPPAIGWNQDGKAIVFQSGHSDDLIVAEINNIQDGISDDVAILAVLDPNHVVLDTMYGSGEEYIPWKNLGWRSDRYITCRKVGFSKGCISYIGENTKYFTNSTSNFNNLAGVLFLALIVQVIYVSICAAISDVHALKLKFLPVISIVALLLAIIFNFGIVVAMYSVPISFLTKGIITKAKKRKLKVANA